MSDLRKAYKEAGVDVEEGYRAVKLMSESVNSTHSKNVLKMLSNFGGLYDISSEKIKNPVLVSGTDGVGTKLKLAFDMNIHDTIGIDLVAMCVNDILCHGAKPLFFLDYFATGKVDADVVANVVSGISNGCKQGRLSLIGGETAEMSGFYSEGEYDLAGFAVGIVDKEKIVDGSKINEGDVIIGLESSGVHSNGFSLVRHIINKNNLSLNDNYGESLLGKELLKPTKIYVNDVLGILDKGIEIKGMAHITGGGFYENIARVLTKDRNALIYKDSFEKLKIFDDLQKWGNIPENEMYATFNMGIGYVLVVDNSVVDSVFEVLNNTGTKAYKLGSIVKGTGEVKLK